MRKLWLGIIVLFLPLISEAKYIIGGEIFYDNQGGGNYLITLNLYRDCSVAPIIPFEKPASVMVYDANGTFIQTITLQNPDSFPVPPTISNPCFVQPPGVCVYGATYTTTVNLPPKTGGYYLVYQRCCRNSALLNVTNSGSVGSTYMEHIPGPEVVAANSSPRFTAFPPTYICVSDQIDFDNTAMDPDGDLLVYSFCAPLTGLDPCCPLLNVAGQTAQGSNCTSLPIGTPCPMTGNPPPYSAVPYISPYTGAYPLSSNPAMQIDPPSGHLSGIPNITGQYVVCVCVKEYRNGTLIGTHMRDFQFNVVNCQNLIKSAIQQQGVTCSGLTIQFNNISSGGIGYSWNFGDPTTLADTSSIKNPMYTFPDTGKYTVTLIVKGPNPSCNDTTKQNFYVYPLLSPSFVAPAGQCVTGNSFNFSAGGQFAIYSTFNWNFSSSATPTSSTQQNPMGINFSQPGNYPVVLTVIQKSCSKSYTDTVHVYPQTQAQFHVDSAMGCQPLSVTFANQSQYGTGSQFLWDFGDGTTSTQIDPTHIYQDTGKFNVSLTVNTTSGCIGTSSVSINGAIVVLPGPKTGFIVNPAHTDIYHNLITFTDTSKNIIQQIVTMGDGTTLNYLPPTHEYDGYGIFTITQIALSSNGCSDTSIRTVIIDKDFTFYVPNTFTPNADVHNNEFKCVSYGIYDFTIVIYDRWGAKVFESTDPEHGWDGTYKGKKCPEDIYVYRVDFTNVVDDYPRTIHGQLHLVR